MPSFADDAAFRDRVRAAMDLVCPALGRIPIDLVAQAVADDLPSAAVSDERIQASLAGIARRNAIAIRDSVSLT